MGKSNSIAIMEPDGRTLKYEILDNETPKEPTMRINKTIAKQLIEELNKIASPNEATQRHLNDTILIRDRLLSLVERNYGK